MVITIDTNRVRELIGKARGNKATSVEADALLLLHGENLEAAINKTLVEFINGVVTFSGE